MTTPGRLIDQHNRPLGVLRLSLTARCNLSCPYCQPDGGEDTRLSLQQRLQLIRACCELGLTTLRLTGGEPLLAPDLDELLQAIQQGRNSRHDPLHQLQEVALTTNGTLLDGCRAEQLKQAGLDRITISLDGATGASVSRMAGLQGGERHGEQLLQRVLQGIAAAKAAGFHAESGAIKLNSVIQRGRNDDQLLPLAELARQQNVELRLIEYMDVGNRNGWSAAEVVPASELLSQLQQRWPLEPLGRPQHGTASRWRYRDGAGHVAAVASISQPFCGDCNRLRVTADGMAYTCLFAEQGHDLRPFLQTNGSAGSLRAALQAIWQQRTDRYSEEREQHQGEIRRPAEMSFLGG